MFCCSMYPVPFYTDVHNICQYFMLPSSLVHIYVNKRIHTICSNNACFSLWLKFQTQLGLVLYLVN